MKSSKVEDHDRKVGAALAFIRARDCNLTQAQFAHNFGISRSLLGSIESGRTPLNAPLGWKICRTLDIHPGWLCAAGNFRGANIFPKIKSERFEKVESMMVASKKALFRDMWSSVHWLLEDVADGEGENDELTIVSEIGNNMDVKAQFPALLRRLKEVTRERGSKTELAKFLGIPLPKVSQWLAGIYEPGGEITLKLLRWVEQQERKKSSSSS